ncbi:HpyAIV family type II restriction enzyme [Mycoplasmopsis californica]|nr:hypothetical protein [Mycoplasmopsis californica]
MEYTSFLIQLKQALTADNGPKLLLKLFEAPYRYNSDLHPFQIQTKMEQSFLRSQENKFYKFLIQCAENIVTNSFSNLNYEHINKNFKLSYLEKDNLPGDENQILSPEEIIKASRSVKFKANITWINKEKKELYIVNAKKYDTASQTEFLDFTFKINERSKALQNNYRDYKIHYILWFVNDFYTNNNSSLSEFARSISNDNFQFSIYYGSGFFSIFEAESQWKLIENHIQTFKNENWDKLLKIPNLNRDPETLEFMVHCSESAWNKISSDDENALKIRQIIFDNEAENSNYKIAMQRRNEAAVEEV